MKTDNELAEKLIKELHEFDGHRNINVVEQIKYFWLVRFDVDNYSMSSIDYVDYGGGFAETVHVCQRKYESNLVDAVKAEIEEESEAEEISEIEANETNEYVIQSDLENNTNDGSWYGTDELVDNVDIHRWFDDHEDEIWEH